MFVKYLCETCPYVKNYCERMKVKRISVLNKILPIELLEYILTFDRNDLTEFDVLETERKRIPQPTEEDIRPFDRFQILPQEMSAGIMKFSFIESQPIHTIHTKWSGDLPGVNSYTNTQDYSRSYEGIIIRLSMDLEKLNVVSNSSGLNVIKPNGVVNHYDQRNATKQKRQEKFVSCLLIYRLKTREIDFVSFRFSNGHGDLLHRWLDRMNDGKKTVFPYFKYIRVTIEGKEESKYVGKIGYIEHSFGNPNDFECIPGREYPNEPRDLCITYSSDSAGRLRPERDLNEHEALLKQRRLQTLMNHELRTRFRYVNSRFN